MWLSNIILIKKTFSPFLAEPQPLQDLCRRTIRKSIGKEHLTKANINTLPIPTSMKQYLLYQQGW
jgi:SPRY domain-containing SOCS box protein 1/4